MATVYTDNYNLGKQVNHSDVFNMNVITDNMDIIDGAMKTNADNISSTATTVAGHTSSINTLTSNVSSIQSGLNSVNNNVNKYAVPKTKTEDGVIRFDDLNDFFNGVMVGRFAEEMWNDEAQSSNSKRGVLQAYDLNHPYGLYMQILWLPTIHHLFVRTATGYFGSTEWEVWI